MMKRLLFLLAAFIILSSLLAVPVHAEDFSDFSDSTVSKNLDNVVGFYGDVFATSGKLLTGDITVSEAVGEITSSAVSHSIDIASTTLGDIVSGDFSLMTPGEFARYIVNLARNGLKNGGADISNFPIGSGVLRFDIPGGGYFELKPYTAYGLYSFDAVQYQILCTVYNPDGSTAFLGTTELKDYAYFTSNPITNYRNVKGDGTINIRLDPSYDVFIPIASNFGTLTRIPFLCDVYENYPSTTTRGFGVTIPWDVNAFLGDNDGSLEQVTSTPDVDNLTDDELMKYIENLIDNLEKTYPDLSTIEGKLQEIINKLDKLGGSDGSAITDLLLALNALIDLLGNFGDAADALIPDELVSVLTDLLDTITQNGGTISKTDLTPVINKIEELQKELLKAYALDYSDNDIKSVISKYNEFSDYLIDKKFAFVGSLTGIINTAVNSYKASGENSMFTVTFNGSSHTIDLAGAFSYEQLDIFRYMIAAFIYVQFAFSVYRRIPAYINNGGDK